MSAPRWSSYWLSFFAVFATMYVVIAVRSPVLNQTIGRPPLPDFSQVFVSEYSGAGWTTNHDIYFHGLFGMDRRLRTQDMFLIGASHTEFGLDAKLASAGLSDLPHPLKVFNLGNGCGGTVQFGLDVLQNNAIFKRKLLIDSFTLEGGLGTCGSRAEDHDTLQAYSSVLTIWSKFLSDWALDLFFPHWTVGPIGVEAHRYLSGSVVFNAWETGDIQSMWNSSEGQVFPTGGIAMNILAQSKQIGINWELPDGKLRLPTEINRMLKSGEYAATFTFIPFLPDSVHYQSLYSSVASRILTSDPSSQPEEGFSCFVAIAPHDLFTWDRGAHLNGSSRSMATTRLLDKTRASRCFW